MATYDNLTDDARLAINRMVAITEKEKRLLHKALNAQASTTSDQSFVDFIPQTAPAYKEGRVYYDINEFAMSYYNEASDVTINLGQESVLRIRNATGAQLDDGTVVYISGSTGDVPQVTKAIATSHATASVIGVCTNTIANNDFGYVTVFGAVRNINTVGFTEGALIYLSDSVAGTYTETPPTIPNEIVSVGVVVKASADGKIFVVPKHVYMHELVDDPSPELGANLDAGDFDIVNAGGISIGTSTAPSNDGEIVLNAPVNSGAIKFTASDSEQARIFVNQFQYSLYHGTSSHRAYRALNATGATPTQHDWYINNISVFELTATLADFKGTNITTTGDVTCAGFTATGNIIQVPNTGIAAFAGGGQGSATLLAKQFNEVGTVATVGDSIKLPTAVVGNKVTVRNTGANALDLFPNTSDSIDGAAVNIAISVAVNGVVTLYAWNATEWTTI